MLIEVYIRLKLVYSVHISTMSQKHTMSEHTGYSSNAFIQHIVVCGSGFQEARSRAILARGEASTRV